MKEEKEVKLIEKAIKQLDYPTPEELFEAVRGKITQREFEAVLGFLLVNHHILIDKGESYRLKDRKRYGLMGTGEK